MISATKTLVIVALVVHVVCAQAHGPVDKEALEHHKVQHQHAGHPTIRASIHSMETTDPTRKCPLCGMDGDEQYSAKFRNGQKVLACSQAHANKLMAIGSEQYIVSVDEPEEANQNDARCPICDMKFPKMYPLRYKEGQTIYACSEADRTSLAEEPYAYLEDGKDHSMTMMMQMYFMNTYKAYVLLESWYTDTVWKYICAVVGTFIGGIVHQFLVRIRMSIKNPKSGASGYMQMQSAAAAQNSTKAHTLFLRLIRTVVYIVTTTLSYLLMLIAMTFNTGLFLAVIFGLGFGYFLFSTEGSSSEKEDNFGCCGESGGFQKKECCKKTDTMRGYTEEHV